MNSKFKLLKKMFVWIFFNKFFSPKLLNGGIRRSEIITKENVEISHNEISIRLDIEQDTNNHSKLFFWLFNFFALELMNNFHLFFSNPNLTSSESFPRSLKASSLSETLMPSMKRVQPKSISIQGLGYPSVNLKFKNFWWNEFFS